MKRDRLDLENNLILVIDEHAIDQEIMDRIENKLLDRNILHAPKILNKQSPLEVQPLAILYLLCKFFYEETNREIMNPIIYFTDNEIGEFKDFQFETKEKSDKIIFSEFKQRQNDLYSGYLDIKDIAELFRQGIATYNKETQRNTTLMKLKNKVIEKITVNQQSVKEITEELLNNEFDAISPIVFNILRDGTEEWDYNDKKQDLIFYKGQLNCTDGFHRSRACMEALLKNPDLKFEFPVTVTVFDVARAKKMIAREAKKNDLSEDYQKSLDTDSLENYIIEDLKNMKELKNKITTDVKAIEFNKALVLYGTLEMAINHNFKYENKRDARKVFEYLQDGFIEITGIFDKEMNENLKETKENTVIAHNLTFIGYVALLSELQGKDRWQSKLENILSSIDFSINNPKWKELNMLSGKVNNSRVKKISEYFKSLVK